ncbi:DegT/DnrJ/EryC1/StrS family aminotransferase [Candidatus Saccharibacteria bacterium]|nr:DegT/DnrJ/EryC1/StrS family aminotransferase [Candidatus Saccharibacteria bacterium]
MDKAVLVTQSSIPTLEEYTEEIKSIFDSKWLTNNGEKHEALKAQLKEFLGVDNLAMFVNGHLALYIAIEAMQFPEGSEIITTPYSFASTTHAIVQNKLKPVFCDIEPENYTIDVDKIEDLITEKTVAIVPVHVYGHVCNVEKIEDIAKRHNLKVIYDAAHVFGVKYNGESIAKWGDVSMFSFHATKVFNTIEGGALVYDDSSLSKVFDYLKNFGIENAESVKAVGMNAKMNEFAAAMGICNLRHFDEEIAKRKKVYDRYVERLSGVDGVKVSAPQGGVESNYAYFPVVFDKDVFGKNRDRIYDELADHKIFARKYFYPLISDYECYREQYDSAETPVAKWVSDNVLTLPMYADLDLEDVDRICDIILGK